MSRIAKALTHFAIAIFLVCPTMPAQAFVTDNPNSKPQPDTLNANSTRPKPPGISFWQAFTFSSTCGWSSVTEHLVESRGDLLKGPGLSGADCSAQVSHAISKNGRWNLELGYQKTKLIGTGIYTPNDEAAQLAAQGIVGQTTGKLIHNDQNYLAGIYYNIVDNKNNILSVGGFGTLAKGTSTFNGTFNGQAQELTEDGVFIDPIVEPAHDFRTDGGLRGGIEISYCRMFGDLGFGPDLMLGSNSLFRLAGQLRWSPGHSEWIKKVQFWNSWKSSQKK